MLYFVKIFNRCCAERPLCLLSCKVRDREIMRSALTNTLLWLSQCENMSLFCVCCNVVLLNSIVFKALLGHTFC